MKNFKTLLLLFLGVSLVLQSCNTKSDKAQESEELDKQENIDSPMVEDTVAVVTMEASTVSKEQLEGMLSGYFNIKNALVNTDAKEARSAAEQLVTSIGEGMNSLSDLVKGMSKKEDVEAIRKDFDKLSANMYQVVKANSEKKEVVVYKQFCPMAFGNQGAFWLSKEDKIANPYFGDKMLRCGKVQEEL